MKIKSLMTLVGLALLLAIQTVSARSTYVSRIPNGSLNSCDNCHDANMNLTAFASAFAPTHAWSASLAAQDSDGDGFSNGQELGDPKGVWVSGGLCLSRAPRLPCQATRRRCLC